MFDSQNTITVRKVVPMFRQRLYQQLAKGEMLSDQRYHVDLLWLEIFPKSWFNGDFTMVEK